MASGNRLFNRFAEVIVGPKTEVTPGSKVEPVSGKVFRTRIKFTVEKTDESTPNTAKISIYNLNQSSRTFLEQKNNIVFLKVGYDEVLQTLFFGDIAENGLTIERQGPDIVSTIECGDAEKELTTAHVEIGFGPDSNNQQIIDKILDALNVGLGPIVGLKNDVYKNGFTFSGSAKELLDTLTKKLSLKWSVQNGELQILPAEQKKSQIQTAVILTPNTGLIGWPTKTETGITAKSLLNTKIVPGGAVQVQSRQLAGDTTETGVATSDAALNNLGTFQVTRADYDGDSYEGPWEVTFEGIIPK